MAFAYKAGVFVLVLNLLAFNAFAGGGVSTGDGAPTQPEPQEVLSIVPAAAEMKLLIDGLSPYDVQLSERLRSLLIRFEEQKDFLVRIHRSSPDHYAGFEAEWQDVGPNRIQLRGISVFLWDNFFSLPTVDPVHPEAMSQVKVLLHEFLHILVSFPELKTQRLTELVYQISRGGATAQQLLHLSRELSDSSHDIVNECDNFFVTSGKETGCRWKLRENFFTAHLASAVDLAGVKIIPYPDTWTQAYLQGDSVVRERIKSQAAWMWMGVGEEDLDRWKKRGPLVPAQLSFYLLAHHAPTSAEKRALMFLEGMGPFLPSEIDLKSICESQFTGSASDLPVPIFRKLVITVLATFEKNSQDQSYQCIGDLHIGSQGGPVGTLPNEDLKWRCQLNESVLNFAPALYALVQSFQTIPVSGELLLDPSTYEKLAGHSLSKSAQKLMRDSSVWARTGIARNLQYGKLLNQDWFINRASASGLPMTVDSFSRPSSIPWLLGLTDRYGRPYQGCYPSEAPKPGCFAGWLKDEGITTLEPDGTNEHIQFFNQGAPAAVLTVGAATHPCAIQRSNLHVTSGLYYIYNPVWTGAP